MLRITKWEQRGMPVAERGARGRPSFYSRAAVAQWKAAEARREQSDEALDLAQERAALARAQKALAEQRYQERARILIPAAEVERTLSVTFAAVRAKILASYTAKADQVFRASVMNGQAGVEACLRDIAHEVLEELVNLAGVQRKPPSRRRKVA